MARPRVRRQLAGAGKLQALDYGLQNEKRLSCRDEKRKRKEKWMEHTVLPAPLGPTIRVKGLKKVITFLFSGSKLRMPLISILSTVLIFFLARSLTHSPLFFSVLLCSLFIPLQLSSPHSNSIQTIHFLLLGFPYPSIL